MTAIDSPRLIARYRDGVRDHLARADALLMRLARDPRAPGAGAELLRILHTLKGESRAMGLGVVADHAHEAEGVLMRWSRDPEAFPENLAVLRRTLDDVATLVEASVGALRLASSGARALPVREAAPLLDLGEVEIGEELAGRLETAEEPETVRVPLDKLEALADISGDLFLGQERAEDRQRRLDDLLALARRQQQLARTLRRALGSGRRDAGAAKPAEGEAPAAEVADELLDMARALRRSLSQAMREDRESTARARAAARDLAQRVRALRVLRLSTLVEDGPRVVHDLGQALDREVRFEASGGELEVDRHVVEELRDPLLHLVQNAVDHGIEPPEERAAAGKLREGLVELRARAEGADLVVEVADDGRGIDPGALRSAAVDRGFVSRSNASALSDSEALDLMFLPGFSSRGEVSEISGRGIGLDVVRDRVRHLGGSVEVETAPGRGSRFILRIPRALAEPAG